MEEPPIEDNQREPHSIAPEQLRAAFAYTKDILSELIQRMDNHSLSPTDIHTETLRVKMSAVSGVLEALGLEDLLNQVQNEVMDDQLRIMRGSH